MSDPRSALERTGRLHAEAVAGQLSRQDWVIVRTLQRVHVASADQLERLHFHSTSERNCTAACLQVIKRLVDLGVLTQLDRHVGTVSDGAAARSYALDAVGLRLVHGPSGRGLRGSLVAGERRGTEALAVTEVFVDLMERSRSSGFTLEDFRTGAAASWPDGLGAFIRPDAFTRLSRANIACYWWFEVDRETDALPTIRSKLSAYVDFLDRGELGPDDVVPRVLIGVLTEERAALIQFLIDGLPEQARNLFTVTKLSHVAKVLVRGLEK